MPIDGLYESFWKKSYSFGIFIFKVMIKHMFNVLVERKSELILFSIFEKYFSSSVIGQNKKMEVNAEDK
jgi:hypothetical protein